MQCNYTGWYNFVYEKRHNSTHSTTTVHYCLFVKVRNFYTYSSLYYKDISITNVIISSGLEIKNINRFSFNFGDPVA